MVVLGEKWKFCTKKRRVERWIIRCSKWARKVGRSQKVLLCNISNPTMRIFSSWQMYIWVNWTLSQKCGIAFWTYTFLSLLHSFSHIRQEKKNRRRNCWCEPGLNWRYTHRYMVAQRLLHACHRGSIHFSCMSDECFQFDSTKHRRFFLCIPPLEILYR